jgi:O-antigen ligase
MLFFRLRIFSDFAKIFPKYTIWLFMTFMIGVFIAHSYNPNLDKYIIAELKVFLTIIPAFYITYIGFKYLNIKIKTIINIFIVGALILTLGAVLFYFFPSLADRLPTFENSVLIDTNEMEVRNEEFTYVRGGASFWGYALISAYLLLLFFPIYVNKDTSKSIREKCFYPALCLLILTTAVINGQRSVWLGFLAGWAFFSLMKGFKGVFIGVLIFLVLIKFLPSEVFGRFSTIFMPSDESWGGRITRYTDAKNIILEHPLFGMGFAASGWVHNFILQIGANLGLVGLFIFLLWLGKLFFNSIKLYRKSGEIEGLKTYLLAFLTSSISFLLPMAGESTINHTTFMIPFWFFCAILQNFNNGNIIQQE